MLYFIWLHNAYLPSSLKTFSRLFIIYSFGGPTFIPSIPFRIRIQLSDLGYDFLKNLNYVPKERENFLQKISPRLSQLNVAMAHRNYFRQNNMQILKLATYSKIEDYYFRCKLQLFRLERIAKMFIFYFVYTKHQVLLICNENKENFCCQFDDTIEVYFLLGINIWGLRSKLDLFLSCLF